MRLVETKSLKLREFIGANIPAYAILSHRWEEGEVLFSDIIDGRGSEKKGWAKLKGSCAKALQDGWEYLWIDTCCIDKSSSAELSESINSMFTWYRNAHVCYAYLPDVPVALQEDKLETYKALSQSVWFTRGWTLQELLAPEWLIFLGEGWSELGTKASLATEITAITGIDHLFNFEDASVAQKMAWAAQRQTTRLEDQAYCMLGLFDVSMPLLYGEGRKAFIRLQLEILSKSDDESIFAWSSLRSKSFPRAGLLAESPKNFQGCGQIKRGDFDPNRPPHFMTNKGLQMELLLQPRIFLNQSPPTNGSIFTAPLNCTIEADDLNLYFVVIYLLQEHGSYSRYGDPDIILTSKEWIELASSQALTRTLVHIKQLGHNSPHVDALIPKNPSYSVMFDLEELYDFGYRLSERLIWPEELSSWSFWADNAVTVTSSKLSIMLLFQHDGQYKDLTIVMGHTSKRPWITATTTGESSLRGRAIMYNKDDWWPKHQDDRRVFQDRVEIDVGTSRTVEGSLHRVAVRNSYGTEKYWVKLNPKRSVQLFQEQAESAELTDLLGHGEQHVVAPKKPNALGWRKTSFLPFRHFVKRDDSEDFSPRKLISKH